MPRNKICAPLLIKKKEIQNFHIVGLNTIKLARIGSYMCKRMQRHLDMQCKNYVISKVKDSLIHKNFEICIRKNFSLQRGYFPLRFPLRKLTTPLRASGHYSSSMMNSDYIKKLLKNYKSLNFF